ncbi:Acetolactate synthase [Gluconacetobacter sp. SXCC-1]|uniref:acetolactate synthase large subunit n=1 Tax=Komagataeibacter rhaeticus TaxID=215221 RepID=UPI000207FDC3|nr:acetolactate synthase large subunit [Komagataeibacter rhaeticus]EGG79228.1 Acetolactate synthase [Gluconacetobacter sp. SXCC-1]
MSGTVARFIVDALEAEGVKYVFGLPGEENIHLVHALKGSNIRFILVRHEQGAAFMADIYGRLTGRAGVCLSTLGPGALNLLLGVADATFDSTPLVAISAQVGLNRIYKETHQIVDLVSVYRPVTKWAETVSTLRALPEIVRKAFQAAEEERPGATFLAIPEDIESADIPATIKPLPRSVTALGAPDPRQVEAAAALIKEAKNPIILAGHGVARARAHDELTALARQMNIPVATTFMGKGCISDKSPLSLGVVGFMHHDYENFAFDRADLILAVGYELQEFAPSKINPDGNRTIIHMHCFQEDVDASYQVSAAVIGNVRLCLEALLEATHDLHFDAEDEAAIRRARQAELARYADDASYPVKPQRIVQTVREVLNDEDVTLVDTGAVKMWMARLYPAYLPLTCLFSNGLATMAYSLPGAIGAHLACPDRKILAVMGDGGFLMNSQEIETAVRENIPLKILIWVDDSFGLIEWKMDLAFKESYGVRFSNPDFTKYAESFGCKGYWVDSAESLGPIISQAINEPGVSIVACPVDYSENMKLSEHLTQIDDGSI